MNYINNINQTQNIMKSMNPIENNRFEIREPIRSFLTTVKDYFGYDACALYLISVEQSMHKTEKEEEFKKRFKDKILKFECAGNEGELKFSGNIGGLKKIKDQEFEFTDESGKKIILKQNNSVIDFIKKDHDENTIEFTKITLNNASNDKKIIVYDANHTPYKVLKFIGVEDSYDDGKKHHWTYDYETRPNKYIVFDKIDDMAGRHVDYVKGEGITAMVARWKNIVVHMDEDQIYTDKEDKKSDKKNNNTQNVDSKNIGSKVRLADSDDTERGIHVKCRELLAIPVYDSGGIKGVIRLDIYNDPIGRKNAIYEDIKESMNKKKSKNKGKPDNRDNIIVDGRDDLFKIIQELCLQVIKVSSDITKKDAYDELFQGRMIIDAILDIKEMMGTKNTSNKKIYDLTKHLFFVFQRHTYIGYDEIIMRTMFYIKDVFKSVGMEKYYDLTERRLYDFRDHENLMLYSTKKYRDHFMHQFHVFVMGYIFMNAIGIDKIKEQINMRLKNMEEYQEITINDEGVLRIWVLISLFHDIAYIFQQYDKTMQKFISDNLLTEIPVHIDWGMILSSNKNKVSYIDTMNELTKFFTSPDEKKSPNKTELLKNYIQAIEDNQDHGVLGAILLINLFKKIIKDNYEENRDEESRNEGNARLVELYLASLAISMHNSCTYKSLKESADKGYICFESFPLEFLLMYCDTAQEWGRKKEVDKVFYDAPFLESIDITKVGQGNNRQTNKNEEKPYDYGVSKIMCNLKYKGLNYPDEEKLNSFFLEKLSKFCSSKISFGVQYKYDKSKSKKTRFYFLCHNDDEINGKEKTSKEKNSKPKMNETTPNEAAE
jgi:hypothetical protein